ncbi:ADP-ribosylglycohydrolase family protein [Levilactobacillus fujinensis]|uniref:ADP-ribosylglycohydrolase family protein n=1 Tax=Levilactobacillus fujinensis TaxID=2486024 RepID=A0ABW1THJ4_9LACO|nr:ADP-ribosylglycohydrolase family protein [Levilactobacillus fujinensis]
MKRQEIMNLLRWAAVADALGVPAEMRKRGSYPEITAMQASGFWQQPAGSWSDDTSMTLCLLENLTSGGDYDDMMQRLESYMRYGTNTPRGEIFGVGRTCAHAVRNYAVNQVTPLACGDASPEANGNGALMRIAPLAVMLQHESRLARRFELTHDYTVLTHRHARSVVGSFILLELLHRILNGQHLGQALVTAGPALTVFLKGTAYAAELPYYRALFATDFSQLPAEAIRTSGYVVDTLTAAVWLALTQKTPKKVILKAVNFGGDTDTIATVAASLVSAEQPTVPVDAEWWRQTLNSELLDQKFSAFADKFAEVS